MMLPLCRNERGAVIPLAVFLIVTLLALAGLAVDAGNLYRAQIQLQKAADAGALAGIGASIIRSDAPGDPELLKDFIETRATEVACENLRLFGYPCDDPDTVVSADYDLGTAELTVTTDADIFFFLMGLVPFEIIGAESAGDSRTIEARAAVRRQTATVALVLDLSSSMACPSTGPCACLSPSRTQTCAEEATALGTTLKVEELKSAVSTFIERFDPARDRITLIPFNIAANVEVPLRPDGALGFTPSDFDVLDGIIPRSNTNVCDGFMTAFQEMSDKGLFGTDDIAYLYFSDGAPTAGRFLLTSPKAGLEGNDPSGFGTHDYLHYSVEWVD
ncbi:MAG: hypothetical protein KDD69_16370, partial [Bdellovibrionales bacterium]|nr:hypothetical protein [Bdellovibrionales bacterium]